MLRKAMLMRNKVLIVEDHPELLKLLRMTLRASGFSVATAANGIEALKKARTLVPDLVVLDLVLPELDGFAVCETLRKSASTASIPIIVLTGLSSQLARLAGLESGADLYLTKPVNPTDLIQHIESLIESRQKAKASKSGAQLPPVFPRSAARARPLACHERN